MRTSAVCVLLSLTAIAQTPPYALPGGEIGAPYSYDFSPACACGSGQVPGFSFIPGGGSFPPGLSLDPSGLLSGTPTAVGQYMFSVIVSDAVGNVVGGGFTFSLTIFPPIMIGSTSPLPQGIAGAAYGPAQIVASGGSPPYRFGIRNTPPGFLLDVNGVLGGTPTTTGTFTFFVTATDSLGIATPEMTFQLTVVAAAPLLQVSESSLTFSAAVNGDAPPPQAVSVVPATGATSTAFTTVLDGGQTGTSAPSWLTVLPTKGTAPAQVIVTADQGTLQTGSNLGRVGVLDANGLPTYVSVTLNVTSNASQLTLMSAGWN